MAHVNIGGNIHISQAELDGLIDVALKKDPVRGTKIADIIARAMGTKNGFQYGGHPLYAAARYPDVDNSTMRVEKASNIDVDSNGKAYQIFCIKGSLRNSASNNLLDGPPSNREYFVAITKTGASCNCPAAMRDKNQSCKHILLTLVEIGVAEIDITDPARFLQVIDAIEEYFLDNGVDSDSDSD